LTEAGAHDQYGVDVTGIDMAGRETVLKNQVTGAVSLSDIDAKDFVYLKLTLNTTDVIDLTPVQLRTWFVTYTPMAEGMLTYKGTRATEVVQEGQSWKSNYGFTNISPRTFSDSLRVQVDIYSSDKHTSARQVFRIKPPAPGDTTQFTIQANTVGKAGLNDIGVFVNPRILPEPYYDNNVLSLYGHLQVNADRSAPLLNVTIDGRHVINGDVVSASPRIEATVIDHNPFMLKTDTVGINLFLRYPCTTGICSYKRINFSNPNVVWKPATSTTEFKITFNPQSLLAGEYALKANAVDGSGNSSGSLPYEVAFVITDAVGFSLQSVYPNPSSDVFNFSLELSGPDAPQDFQLQVYSPTGNLIRNFGNEVLSILHIGTNELSMQATDAQGTPLSAGIYLFRMNATLKGRQIMKTGRLMVVR
jgi:hypothetical protein